MAFILGVFLLMLRGDAPAPIEVYRRAFASVASDSATIAFLDPDAGSDVRSLLKIADSIYTLDRFPFDSHEDTDAVSVYRAEVFRPLRTAYLPALAQMSFPGALRGILFFSFLEDSTLLAEVFPFRGDGRSYEDYCLSTDSLKFLFSVPPSGIPQLQGRRRLLR